MTVVRVVVTAPATAPPTACSRSDLAEEGTSKVLGETEGFVELVPNAGTGVQWGAHIVGELADQGFDLLTIG